MIVCPCTLEMHRRPTRSAERRCRPAASASAIAERDACPSTRPSTRPCRSSTRTPRQAPSSSRRVPCRRDDRRGQRMLAAALEAGGEPQQLVLGRPSPAATIGHDRGLPSVSVPVLSTTSVSTCSSTSSASAFLNSTPARRAAPGADHDRHRRRQPERAGTGDDQHRHRVDQRVGQPRLGADQRPRRRRSQSPPRSRRARTRPTPDRPGAGSARG